MPDFFITQEIARSLCAILLVQKSFPYTKTPDYRAFYSLTKSTFLFNLSFFSSFSPFWGFIKFPARFAPFGYAKRRKRTTRRKRI